MSLRALLFDLDGTLVDTEDLHRQAFNQAFLSFQLPWEWDADRYADLLTVSGGQERIAEYVDTLALPASEKTRIRRLIPGLHREKTRLYAELRGSSSARARPGIGRLIDEALANGIKVGIASTSALANVAPLLDAVLGRETANRIGAVTGADLVTRKKPSPDIYELLLTTLGASASECVAFEDSGNGVRAAKAAGLFTVATPTRWTRDQDFGEADLVLPSLGDPDAPVDPGAAARIGGATYLGLEQLSALSARGPRP